MGVQGAIYKLDQQFLYLLSHISSLIGPAKYALADDCQQNYLKTKSYGWSLVGGGLLDTASDFFGNFRSAEDVLTMADVGFSYVYNNAYGIGLEPRSSYPPIIQVAPINVAPMIFWESYLTMDSPMVWEVGMGLGARQRFRVLETMPRLRLVASSTRGVTANRR